MRAIFRPFVEAGLSTSVIVVKPVSTLRASGGPLVQLQLIMFPLSRVPYRGLETRVAKWSRPVLACGCLHAVLRKPSTHLVNLAFASGRTRSHRALLLLAGKLVSITRTLMLTSLMTRRVSTRRRRPTSTRNRTFTENRARPTKTGATQASRAGGQCTQRGSGSRKRRVP